MTKIKISESQFRKLVREEGEKIKKEIILKSMLNKIDSELNELNEVHAGGDMAPGKDGVHAGQKKPVFTKKGTHLVEDQDDAVDMDSEMGAEDGVEMGVDVPMEAQGGETLDKASVMAAIQDLGNKLELDGVIEFTGEVEGDEMGAEMGAEDGVEMDADGEGEAEAGIEVDVENGAEDAEGSEESEETEEVEQECDTTMQEKDETPEEQRSVVSESPEQINENADPKKKKLNEEVNRWKFLAGIK